MFVVFVDRVFADGSPTKAPPQAEDTGQQGVAVLSDDATARHSGGEGWTANLSVCWLSPYCAWGYSIVLGAFKEVPLFETRQVRQKCWCTVVSCDDIYDGRGTFICFLFEII